MTKKVQCDNCGYIFDCEDDQEFGYCPCCENDQVEVNPVEQLNTYSTIYITSASCIYYSREILILYWHCEAEKRGGGVSKFSQKKCL